MEDAALSIFFIILANFLSAYYCAGRSYQLCNDHFWFERKDEPNGFIIVKLNFIGFYLFFLLIISLLISPIYVVFRSISQNYGVEVAISFFLFSLPLAAYLLPVIYLVANVESSSNKSVNLKKFLSNHLQVLKRYSSFSLTPGLLCFCFQALNALFIFYVFFREYSLFLGCLFSLVMWFGCSYPISRFAQATSFNFAKLKEIKKEHAKSAPILRPVPIEENSYNPNESVNDYFKAMAHNEGVSEAQPEAIYSLNREKPIGYLTQDLGEVRDVAHAKQKKRLANEVMEPNGH